MMTKTGQVGTPGTVVGIAPVRTHHFIGKAINPSTSTHIPPILLEQPDHNFQAFQKVLPSRHHKRAEGMSVCKAEVRSKRQNSKSPIPPYTPSALHPPPLNKRRKKKTKTKKNPTREALSPVYVVHVPVYIHRQKSWLAA